MKSAKLLKLLLAVAVLWAIPSAAQTPSSPPDRKARPQAKATPLARPKLVVLLVVDQMRGDYVDKFQGQWTGG
jgi:hypothetical protein